MEENNLLDIKSKSKQVIVIIDENEFDYEKLNSIKEKCNKNKFSLLYNNIGYAIKVIESCNEVIQNECDKLDSVSYKKPLIISNILLPEYKDNLSLIKSVNDIIIELLSFSFIKLELDTQIYVVTDCKDKSLVDNDKVIYLTYHDFLNLNEFTDNNKNENIVSKLNLDRVSLHNVVDVYEKIMTKGTKYIKSTIDNVITYSSKNHSINFLLIDTFDDLEKYSIDLYDVIVIDCNNDLNNDLLINETINYIYENVKSIGRCFKEEI